MKKINLLVFLMILLIPFSVLADTNPSVKTLKTDTKKSTINYNGTMEDGSHAVMCKLYNSKGEEIDLLSSSVEDNKFSGSFTDVSSGTYNVACANYEGGEIKKVEVTVDTSKNPKTSDTGIYSIAMIIMSMFGLFGSALYLKKEK